MRKRLFKAIALSGCFKKGEGYSEGMFKEKDIGPPLYLLSPPQEGLTEVEIFCLDASPSLCLIRDPEHQDFRLHGEASCVADGPFPLWRVVLHRETVTSRRWT